MTDSLKFGPEWLRNLSQPSDGTMGPLSGGPVAGINASAPRYLLADHRYGREEMLALYDHTSELPSILLCLPMLAVEKSQAPLALFQMSEEETRMWQRGINSEPMLRILAKLNTDGPMRKPAQPSPLTMAARERERTRGGASGGGGSLDRGRGRGMRNSGNNYYRGYSFEEEPSKEAGGVPITSYGSKGRYERSQSSSQDRSWGEKNGSDSAEWNGSTSPRKDLFGRGAMDNWRKPGNSTEEEGTGWKTTGSNKWNRSDRSDRNTWRSDQGEKGEPVEETYDDFLLKLAYKTSELGPLVPPRTVPWHLLRRGIDDVDDLPEWAMAPCDLKRLHKGGSFDASGAFRGGTLSDEEEDTHGAKEKQSAGNDEKAHEEVCETVEQSKEKTVTTNNVCNKKDKDDVSSSKAAGIWDTESTDSVLQPSSDPSPVVSPIIDKKPKHTVPGIPRKYPDRFKKFNEDDMEQMRKVATDLVAKLTDEEEPIKGSDIWYYFDPHRVHRGPFTSQQMLGWYNFGYFDDNLELRRQCDKEYMTLSELVALSRTNPFYVPHMPPKLQKTPEKVEPPPPRKPLPREIAGWEPVDPLTIWCPRTLLELRILHTDPCDPNDKFDYREHILKTEISLAEQRIDMEAADKAAGIPVPERKGFTPEEMWVTASQMLREYHYNTRKKQEALQQQWKTENVAAETAANTTPLEPPSPAGEVTLRERDMQMRKAWSNAKYVKNTQRPEFAEIEPTSSSNVAVHTPVSLGTSNYRPLPMPPGKEIQPRELVGQITSTWEMPEYMCKIEQKSPKVQKRGLHGSDIPTLTGSSNTEKVPNHGYPPGDINQHHDVQSHGEHQSHYQVYHQVQQQPMGTQKKPEQYVDYGFNQEWPKTIHTAKDLEQSLKNDVLQKLNEERGKLKEETSTGDKITTSSAPDPHTQFFNNHMNPNTNPPTFPPNSVNSPAENNTDTSNPASNPLESFLRQYNFQSRHVPNQSEVMWGGPTTFAQTAAPMYLPVGKTWPPPGLISPAPNPVPSINNLIPWEMKTEQQVLQEQLLQAPENKPQPLLSNTLPAPTPSHKDMDAFYREAALNEFHAQQLRRQQVEAELRQKEEEKQRLEEEMKRLREEEEARKAEAERLRLEEQHKLEQLRLEEERRRARVEELARQQEELHRKKKEEILKNKEEMIKIKEEVLIQQEKVRQEREDEMRAFSRELQKRETQQTEEKQVVERNKAEDQLRQEAALKMLKENQLIQQQQLLQHQKMLQQQQQNRSTRSAPWIAAATTTSTATSLAEIQKLQEKERKEQEKEQIEANAQVQAAQQRQNEATSSRASMPIDLKWAELYKAPANATKSLAEIQKEEQRQLMNQMKAKGKTSLQTASNAGVWKSASSNLSWVPTPAPSAGNAWSLPATTSSSATTNNSAPSSSIWGTGASNDNTPNPSTAVASSSISTNAKSKSAKNRTKKEEQQVMKLFEQKSEFADDFTTWCVQTLSGLQSSVDIPTFVTFLKDIESPFEVHDYVRSYLGEGKDARDFARSFLERRSKWRNSQKAAPAEDDMCKPAPAVNPLSNDFQEVKGKGKKTKKNKMYRVADNHLLGFSVTASKDRINVGDLDYGEGM